MPGPSKREKLVSFFVAFRAEEALKDAKNSTSYQTEFECLSRQLAEKTPTASLLAYVKERWEEKRQAARKPKPKPKPKCPDCYVKPGHPHDPGCDVETCPECGLQRLSCGCQSSLPPVPWDGESVLARDAKRNQLYAKLLPGRGWTPCDKDDPEATPDLNSVPGQLAWNTAKQRWEPKPGQ